MKSVKKGMTLRGLAVLVLNLALAGSATESWGESSTSSDPQVATQLGSREPDTPTLMGADQAGTMIATLQKQLVEQQSLLRQLQENMGTVKPSVVADAAAAPTSIPTDRVTAPANTERLVPGAAEHAGAPTGVPETPPASAAVASPVLTATPVDAGQPSAAAPAASSAPVSAQTEGPQTAAQRQAYASGVSVWREIESSMTAQRSMGIELDPAWVMQGLQDMANRQPLRMSRDQVDTIMVTLNEIYMEKAREVRERQQTEGRAYQSAF
ncbi:FKBP-type peptidyl-prolyl cis-trans isomerase N-terminal domain-containing protein, partial [Enterobacter sp. 200527-13]|uniref:FKBP-type peptidyl-prolyl cis-trans isomerase N-terminal domain-containing protein n=1 Tax=Enterobacter sp. 200527-13 TaxID=2995131 RepID=UPI0024922058